MRSNSGCSTVGSAPRSGRGGRKFESSHPDPFRAKRLQVDDLQAFFNISEVRDYPWRKRDLSLDNMVARSEGSMPQKYTNNEIVMHDTAELMKNRTTGLSEIMAEKYVIIKAAADTAAMRTRTFLKYSVNVTLQYLRLNHIRTVSVIMSTAIMAHSTAYEGAPALKRAYVRGRHSSHTELITIW